MGPFPVLSSTLLQKSEGSWPCWGEDLPAGEQYVFIPPLDHDRKLDEFMSRFRCRSRRNSRVFAIANVGMWVSRHDHASFKTIRRLSRSAWGGKSCSTHQKMLASVIETMFWTSCLATKLFFTTGDPKTEVAADAIKTIKVVA